jgi:hypothetical protein
MKLTRAQEDWLLELEWLERIILAASFEQQAAHYRVPMETLDERMRAYWRGSLSKSKKKELQEAEDDLASMRSLWRSERLKTVEEWLKTINTEEANRTQSLTLTSETLEQWIQILNERRLILAAEHEVSETEMNFDLCHLKDESLKRVIMEIQLLGVIVHTFALALDGDIDSWGEVAES